MEDHAVLDKQDSAGVTCRLDRMRDHDDRLTVCVELTEDIKQAVSGFGIERTSRFIGEQELGFCDDRAGDRGALLLTAGDLIGKLIEQIMNAEHLCHRLEPLLHIVILHAGEHERQKDIVAQGEIIKQIEILEDEAKIFSAESGKRFVADFGKRLAVKQHIALCRLVECCKDIEQRGFAGTGFAHDGDIFALLD